MTAEPVDNCFFKVMGGMTGELAGRLRAAHSRGLSLRHAKLGEERLDREGALERRRRPSLPHGLPLHGLVGPDRQGQVSGIVELLEVEVHWGTVQRAAFSGSEGDVPLAGASGFPLQWSHQVPGGGANMAWTLKLALQWESSQLEVEWQQLPIHSWACV